MKNSLTKKIKILALCDSPTTATGFAQVSKNVLKGLHDTGNYEIDVIGINYFGDYYDRQKYPYNIYPAQPQGYRDMYGRERFIEAIQGKQVKQGLVPPWDIIFTIQDPFIIEGLGAGFPFGDQLRVTHEMWKRLIDTKGWFTWIAYFPVDAPVKENWVTKSIALPNYPVAYCEWGKEQILKYDREEFDVLFNLQPNPESEKVPAALSVEKLQGRIRVIPHGVDLKAFYPKSTKEKKEFRKEFWKGKLKDDTFLVVNISRNQPRKDLPRTIMAFAEFKKIVPNSHLYLHCQTHDVGGSIDEIARNFNLTPGEDYSVPYDFSAGLGYGVDVINNIYNAADICVTTTLGEGWGFITTEAMATKTPIVAPNITSILDIFDSKIPENQDLNQWLENGGYEKVRGVPVKAGSTKSEWFSMGIEDNERLRPLTNVEDLVNKILWVYNNKDKVEGIVDRAYNWVQNLSWQNIVKQWDELFAVAYKELRKERDYTKAFDIAGRNDPCPCGSGKKFKKCHLEEAEKKRKDFSDWINKRKEIDGKKRK